MKILVTSPFLKSTKCWLHIKVNNLQDQANPTQALLYNHHYVHSMLTSRLFSTWSGLPTVFIGLFWGLGQPYTDTPEKHSCGKCSLCIFCFWLQNWSLTWDSLPLSSVSVSTWNPFSASDPTHTQIWLAQWFWLEFTARCLKHHYSAATEGPKLLVFYSYILHKINWLVIKKRTSCSSQ